MLKLLTIIIASVVWHSAANATDYPPPGSHIQVTRNQLSQYTRVQIAKAIAYAKAHKITWNIIEDAQANSSTIQK